MSQSQAKLSELVTSLGGSVVKGTQISASTSLVVVKDEAASSCMNTESPFFSVFSLVVSRVLSCI